MSPLPAGTQQFCSSNNKIPSSLSLMVSFHIAAPLPCGAGAGIPLLTACPLTDVCVGFFTAGSEVAIQQKQQQIFLHQVND